MENMLFLMFNKEKEEGSHSTIKKSLKIIVKLQKGKEKKFQAIKFRDQLTCKLQNCVGR